MKMQMAKQSLENGIGIKPKHLNSKIFLDMIQHLRDARIKCKHSKEKNANC